MTLKNNYLIHPFEVCFLGQSRSGKTSLITTLIEELSKKMRVGYIKNNAPHFQMDKEGKDTFLAKEAGAFQVSINSNDALGFISNAHEDRFLLKNLYLDCDVVLIEGDKKNLMNKVFIYSGSNEDKTYLESTISGEETSLIAVIGEPSVLDIEVGELPYFQRDDTLGILNFISAHFDSMIKDIPLYGLILGGGRSTRMGKDKGKLKYHGKCQVEYLYDLLNSKLEKNFISCRDDQVEYDAITTTINDRFLGFGPSGGILSAFEFYPNAAWLVVACDMPYIDEEVIDDLLSRRNPFRLATCFLNDEKKWPEPLCTIYEPKARLRIGNYLAQGRSCPRKVLMNSQIELLVPKNRRSLNNINTPREYDKAISEIIGESL